MAANSSSLLERLSGGVISNTPGGRQGRVKSTTRPNPYSASPRTSVGPDGSLPLAKHIRRDADSPWKHDMFAPYNGISGGELGARLNGDVGRQTTTGGAGGGEKTVAKKALQDALGLDSLKRNAAANGGGISIKGSATALSTIVEVDGLAPGTTAEDVAEIFSQCGPVLERRLLSKPSDPTARVFIKFETASAAQAAVSQFDKQPADGRVLSVSITNSALGSRLGVKGRAPSGPVDLLAPSQSATGGMRSDEILRSDPRAKVITHPSGASNKPLQTIDRGGPSNHRGQGGRGRGGKSRGRGRGKEQGNSLIQRMDVD